LILAAGPGETSKWLPNSVNIAVSLEGAAHFADMLRVLQRLANISRCFVLAGLTTRDMQSGAPGRIGEGRVAESRATRFVPVQGFDANEQQAHRYAAKSQGSGPCNFERANL
jgi:hypothetical protein